MFHSLSLILSFWFLVTTTITSLVVIAQAHPFVDSKTSPYTKWVQDRAFFYTHHRYLFDSAEQPRVSLHWSIVENDNDEENTMLKLAVAAPTTGWFGLGWAEMGGMPGSDILLWEKQQPDQVSDLFATAYQRPVLDAQQDWTLTQPVVFDGTMVILEVQRRAYTHDAQDWVLVDDRDHLWPRKMIAAWGATDEMHYHGPHNRLQESMFWYPKDDQQDDDDNDDIKTKQTATTTTSANANRKPVNEVDRLRAQLEQESEGSVLLSIKHQTLSKKQTTYIDTCFSIEELIQQQGLPPDRAVHVIGMEWIQSQVPGHHKPHHIMIHNSVTNMKECDTFKGPHNQFLGWANGGALVQAFPPDIGFLMADGSGQFQGRIPQKFRIEVHYENLERVTGLKVSAGIRLYYTTKLRQHTGAVLELADPYVKLYGRPVGSGLNTWTFTCPPSCLQEKLAARNITILYEFFHMHSYGGVMENVHYRNNQVIDRSVVQYFDFNQGIHMSNRKPYQVQAGDSWETRCHYNSTRGVKFSNAFSGEMCLMSLYYYPALEEDVSCTWKSFEGGPACEAKVAQTKFTDWRLVGREFGETPLVVEDDGINSKKAVLFVLLGRLEVDLTMLSMLLLVLVAMMFGIGKCRQKWANSQYKKVATREGNDMDLEQDIKGDDRNCSLLRRRL